MAVVANLDEVFPLRIMAADGRVDLFVQFRLYDTAGAPAGVFNATHVAEGMYSADWTPTTEGYFTVIGQLYLDAGHTVDAGYEKASETLEASPQKKNIARLLGLHNENSVIDQQVYNGNGHLTSARLRVYDTKPNAIAAGVIGLVASYTVAAVYDPQARLTKYTMVRDA